MWLPSAPSNWCAFVAPGGTTPPSSYSLGGCSPALLRCIQLDQVDLFASHLSYQLPCFFRWKPDPLAEATDAFWQDWSKWKAYANISWCLTGKVLAQVSKQQAQVILIASGWEAQPWYLILLRILVEIPALLPTTSFLQQMSGHTTSIMIMPQLAMWPISGINSQPIDFQNKFQNLCWSLGDLSLQSHMTLTSGSGQAGMINGVMIPFHAL